MVAIIDVNEWVYERNYYSTLAINAWVGQMKNIMRNMNRNEIHVNMGSLITCVTVHLIN